MRSANSQDARDDSPACETRLRKTRVRLAWDLREQTAVLKNSIIQNKVPLHPLYTRTKTCRLYERRPES